MFNCLQTARRLHRYLDRDLTEDEVEEVKRHLDACPPCRHHFHFEVGIRRLVRAKCSSEGAPDRLRHFLLNALRSTSQ